MFIGVKAASFYEGNEVLMLPTLNLVCLLIFSTLSGFYGDAGCHAMFRGDYKKVKN